MIAVTGRWLRGALVAGVLAQACAGWPRSGGVRPAAELDPEAAAVGFQALLERVDPVREGATLVCLALRLRGSRRAHDAPPVVVGRFDSLQTPVRGNAECADGAAGGVLDRRSGRPALRLTLTLVNRHGDEDVELLALYSTSWVCENGYRFRVARREGRWEIVSALGGIILCV